MGIVYRALDRLRGQPVALKQVTVPTDQLQLSLHSNGADLRLSLAKEFRFLASMVHPHIISVLDYGFDDHQQPYFTMELLDSTATILDTGKAQPLDTQIALLVELLQALAYLHRRGIIHRDLKPSNILTSNQHIKVLDFGLSASDTDTSQKDDSLSGTLTYIAPELFIGMPPSESNDLYAVGIIAYQLFSGRHPFNTDNVAQLIYDTVNSEPNCSPAALGVKAEVALVVKHLLAKKPVQRYSSAAEVIVALQEATRQALHVETVATRESYLQAAKFIGRDDDLRRLLEALANVIQGSSQSWLIAGESGVGKSRLLDELRIQSLVRGAYVVQGQAVSGEFAYHLWRDVARWLSLQSDLSDLEAGVLKVLVPDVATIRQQMVPDPPLLDPQSTQDRLIATFETLLSRQHQPLVLILEDLHWADTESIKLLSRLVQSNALGQLLIVGSYRDDEVPYLPQQLPAMRVHKLERLSSDHIAALSAAILGKPGKDPKLIGFLQRETEGNAFFLIEVIRTLAEHIGELDKIHDDTLPEQITAIGIQNVVKRRLERLPDDIRSRLNLAAVLGREIDLSVLEAAQPTYDWIAWLAHCAEYGVLDIQDERWRFAHDKLREGVLVELDGEARAQLHCQVAQAIEVVYRDQPAYAAMLAYHWNKAGDIEQERHYSALAGERALQEGASQEAVRLLSRTLELGIPDTIQQAHLAQLLSEAFWTLGELDKSFQYALETLHILDFRVPQTPAQVSLQMISQLLRQAAHRLVPRLAIRHSLGKQAKVIRTAARTYERLAILYYFENQSLLAVYSNMKALNLNEQREPSPELARCYSYASVGFNLIRLPGVGEYYLKLGLQTAQIDLAASYWATAAGGVFWIGKGDFDKAELLLNKALEITRQIGNPRGVFDINFGYSVLNYASARFEECRKTAWESYASSIQSGLTIGLRTAIMFDVAVLLVQDRLSEMRIEFQTLEDIAQAANASEQICIYALLGACYRRLGDSLAAHKFVETGYELALKAPPTVYSSLLGYTLLAEAFLAKWEVGDTAQAVPAKQIVSVLGHYAAVYRVGVPTAQRVTGLYHWLNGQHKKAFIAWKKGLAVAEQLQTEYEQGLLCYEIGRHLSHDDPEREQHLTKASEIFQRLDAKPEF
jgi:tetratricopeptide (TPR) repeat protein